jgi:hypothetical protein
MTCHECLTSGADRQAVAVCKFCMVGLCKQHLVESFRAPGGVAPQYACKHQPASP